jgi:hypothetical protein
VRFIINRVPPTGGTAAPSVPIYASAAYGCALAHSPQTTREVRATFYSGLASTVLTRRLAPLVVRGLARTVPGTVPRRCTLGFHRSPPRVGAISPAIYPCPTLGFDPGGTRFVINRMTGEPILPPAWFAASERERTHKPQTHRSAPKVQPFHPRGELDL